MAVVDGRGLTPLRYAYNMLQVPCYQQSIDSGSGRTLLDVAGQPHYAWDADDMRTEMVYDGLRRPLQRITDGRVLDRYIYGESLINPEEQNFRGQLYQSYDGSGKQQVNGYDFKGNPLEAQLQLLNAPEITDADWSTLDDNDLSTELFASQVLVDAINRPMTTTDPGGNVQAYTYDKGGALKTVELNAQVYVQDIHYDAKGQRMAIWYGNGTKTSYTYDPETYRLRRLLTVNLNNNEILQDLHYWYDPIGNITEIQDDAQQSIFYNNTVVSPRQQFTYDAIYRLIQAQGRELIGTATFGIEDNWNDAAWQTTQKGDGNAVQNYTQLYTYDAVGNLLELQHIATAGSYTRTYEIASDNNQLLNTTVGAATYTYQYEARGNMAAMPHLDAMHWNLNNELHQIENGTMQAYYQYSGGQRIRKYVAKGNITEERIYLGSFEIYRKFENSSLIIERTTVHASDDTGRIAMLEMRTEGNAGDDHGTAEELTRYIYSNHLQSASLELDETGEVISYEEYHPYGTTSYQAMNASIHAVAKRYRYTGKERDEESGLYYHGARYYIPWLCRWTAVDALESKYAGMSPYNYCLNNPVKHIDDDGKGVIYSNSGKILGNNGNDDKAYVSSQAVVDKYSKDGKTDWSKVITDKDTKLLDISNSDLNIFANTIAVESSGEKEETYAIANAIVNLNNVRKDKSYVETIQKAGIYGYKDGGNSTEYKNNKKYSMEAVINSVTGGYDYSNGATQWDGRDLEAWGTAHFRYRKAVFDDRIGIFVPEDKIQTVNKVVENVVRYYSNAKPDISQNFINAYDNQIQAVPKESGSLWTVTAGYGQTVFYKENPVNMETSRTSPYTPTWSDQYLDVYYGIVLKIIHAKQHGYDKLDKPTSSPKKSKSK